MKASLVLELIGDNNYQYGKSVNKQFTSITGLGCNLFSVPSRSWCAKITDLDPKYKWKREFLKGMKDYSNSNSKGSRGVTSTYILDEWNVYEVKRSVSWGNSERFFCIVNKDGMIEKISEDQVENFIRY